MTLDLERNQAEDGTDHDSTAVCELCHRLEALWCCGGLICDTTGELEQSDLWRAEREEQAESIRLLQQFIGEAIPNGPNETEGTPGSPSRGESHETSPI